MASKPKSTSTLPATSIAARESEDTVSKPTTRRTIMDNPPLFARYEIVLITEGIDCNPNGDPDKAGAPRQDEDTNHALVSNGCINHKVRERWSLLKEGVEGYAMFINRGVSIEAMAAEAGKAAKVKPSAKMSGAEIGAFYREAGAGVADLRTFGGMPGMGAWAGLPSLHGAVTTTTGRSIYPVTVQEHCITRCAPANEKQDKKQEMGMSYSIPHCVLRQAFHVDPYRAKKNGFSLRDLAIFVDLLAYLYDHERAGMRGTMNVRGLYLFCHESPLGNARSSDLFDRLEITCDDYKTARSWKDYSMKFDDTNMPRGVTVLTLDDLGGGEEAILTTLKGLRAA